MIYLILLFGLILRVINLNQSFWLDEAAQVIESSRPLSQQLDIASDFHPPLFHLLLHFWLYLGHSEVVIRILSVILGLGSIFIFYKLACLFLNEKQALLSSLLLAINPYHIWYSQESRPYILFVFTSVLATYFLVKKNYQAYVMSLTGAFYSVYTAILMVPAHFVFIYMLDKKQLRSWFKSLGFSILMFLVWMPHFWRSWQIGFSAALSGWTNVVSVSAMKLLPLTLAKFIYGRGSIANNIVYALVILPVVGQFFWGSFRSIREKKLRIWLILFWLPLILGQLVAFILPVMAPQRLIFLLPFFILLVVIGLEKLKSQLFYLIVVVVILISLAGVTQYYTNPYVQREQWRQAVRFVENTSRGNSLAIFVFPDAFAPWLWYSQGRVDFLAVAPNFRVTEQVLANYSTKIKQADQIFYFHYLADLTDTQGMTEKYIRNLGYIEKSKTDFPGVGFVSQYAKYLAFN